MNMQINPRILLPSQTAPQLTFTSHNFSIRLSFVFFLLMYWLKKSQTWKITTLTKLAMLNLEQGMLAKMGKSVAVTVCTSHDSSPPVNLTKIHLTFISTLLTFSEPNSPNTKRPEMTLRQEVERRGGISATCPFRQQRVRHLMQCFRNLIDCVYEFHSERPNSFTLYISESFERVH